MNQPYLKRESSHFGFSNILILLAAALFQFQNLAINLYDSAYDI